MAEVRRLLEEDAEETPPRDRAIFRVWPDFPVRALIDGSVATIKADAAQRSFDAGGQGITWAVIDSGIDGGHPHFAAHGTLGGDVAELHRDFTAADGGPASVASALTDANGHGTHVAGILAGGLPTQPPADLVHRVFEHEQVVLNGRVRRQVREREVADAWRLSGVAPRCKLVSLKALDASGNSSTSTIIRALQYLHEEVNGGGRLLRVQGVNLSLGYEFDAEWYACGQSPLCKEVNRLVRAGVVVVAAAGNTGYGDVASRQGQTSGGLALTINDPGNADLAITVGSTHRDSPYTFGVSFFSSKGPTGDGRLKPDLIAPGERITSCATGKMLAGVPAAMRPAGGACYIDHSGTSMAAPHVSGAIAAFLSVRREFIGRPEEVKRIFLASATSLGRERYFEGHGLVDLMRAIQSV
jgi:subtilisin family serine protease